MKLLVLSNRYPPYIKGGYEVMCFELSEQLKRRGHDVVVLTGLYGIDRPTVKNGIHRLLHRFNDSYKILERTRWEQEDKNTLRRLIAEFKPEAIFIWNLEELFLSLNLIAKEAGVPIFYNIQDIWLIRWIDIQKEWRNFWYQPGNNLFKRIGKSLLRSYFTLRDAFWMQPIGVQEIESRYFIFVSNYRKRQHIKAGFAAQDAPVIYNGIDLKRFGALTRTHSSKEVKFLYAGRLEESKGAHVAIEAAMLLRSRGCTDWTLSIYGVPEPPYEYVEGLREKVKANGLEQFVKFCEPVPNDRMPEIYAQHDALIFPSIGPEGFSVTLIEAMACGLTVVGTTTGGSAEILHHEENSLTFEPGDAVTLATHLERIIKEADLRIRLAETAKRLIYKNFTLEKMVDETEQYILKVLNQ